MIRFVFRYFIVVLVRIVLVVMDIWDIADGRCSQRVERMFYFLLVHELKYKGTIILFYFC